MKKKSGKKNSGFPITNVGNDRRGFFVGNDRRSFVGNNRRGSFHMGERDADDVRDENHEATGFFQRMAIIPPAPFPLLLQGPLSVIPAGPSLSYPPAPFCHARRPLSVMPAGPSLSCPLAPLCYARRLLSVMPAGSSLSCPPAPLCHAAGPSLSYSPALLCHARRPPSVIPAVFSGNPVKTVFLQGSTRESYSFDKASMTAE